MTSPYDPMLLRKQFSSLSSDAQLTLICALHGHSDEEIIARYKAWKFSRHTIARSFTEARHAFALPDASDSRAVVIDRMRECQLLGMFQTPSPGTKVPPPVVLKATVSAPEPDEEKPMEYSSRIPLEPSDRVLMLSKAQLQVLERMAAGATDEELMRVYKCSRDTVGMMIRELLDVLQIDAHETPSRRKIQATSMYRRHLLAAKKSHVPPPEVLPQTPASDTRPTLAPVPGVRPAHTRSAAPKSVSAFVPPPLKRKPHGAAVCMYNGINVNEKSFRQMFAANVAMIAKVVDISLTQLSLSVNKSSTYLSFLKSSGTGMLDDAVIIKLARELHVSPEFLATNRVLAHHDIADEHRRLGVTVAHKQTPRSTGEPDDLARFTQDLFAKPELAACIAELVKLWTTIDPAHRRHVLQILAKETT